MRVTKPQNHLSPISDSSIGLIEYSNIRHNPARCRI